MTQAAEAGNTNRNSADFSGFGNFFDLPGVKR